MRVSSKLAISVILAAAGGIACGAAPYRDLHDFSGPVDGQYPLAQVVTDGKGHVYGTTLYGGAFGSGTIYRLTVPKTPTGPAGIDILHDFQSIEGTIPEGGVTIGPDGALYGTANAGGLHNVGTVYRLDPATRAFTKLHDFDSDAVAADGYTPVAGLTVGPGGLLYGTTGFGGPNRGGTAFAISPRGDRVHYETIYGFGAPGDGADPYIGRLAGSGNKLFGTTHAGGNFNGYGTAFQLVLPKGKTQWVESVLYAFGSQAGDAFLPNDGLALDSDGTLYGCAAGGHFAQGAVYSLTPSAGTAWTETVIESFGATPGEPRVAQCSVVIDGPGRLIGTSDLGGDFGKGTVFSLTRGGGGWTLEVLHSFGASADDPMNPTSPVAAVGKGNFVGSAWQGGSSGIGAVYGIKP